jgi:hypothetical protein
MNAKCAVCGRWFHPNRSKRLCDSHYWRVRRLQEKTSWEIERKVRELEIIKACIDEALHAPDDADPTVAPAQLQRDGQ